MFLNTMEVPPNGYQGRGVYKTTVGHVTIRKLDPGPSNAFVFYIFSLAPDFVRVTMPLSATLAARKEYRSR